MAVNFTINYHHGGICEARMSNAIGSPLGKTQSDSAM